VRPSRQLPDGRFEFFPTPVNDAERRGWQFAVCESGPHCCGHITVICARMADDSWHGPFIYWPASAAISSDRHAGRMEEALALARTLGRQINMDG
jgi:hypothetical protein